MTRVSTILAQPMELSSRELRELAADNRAKARHHEDLARLLDAWAARRKRQEAEQDSDNDDRKTNEQV
jgi:hypothetical protein